MKSCPGASPAPTPMSESSSETPNPDGSFGTLSIDVSTNNYNIISIRATVVQLWNLRTSCTFEQAFEQPDEHWGSNPSCVVAASSAPGVHNDKCSTQPQPGTPRPGRISEHAFRAARIFWAARQCRAARSFTSSRRRFLYDGRAVGVLHGLSHWRHA